MVKNNARRRCKIKKGNQFIDSQNDIVISANDFIDSLLNFSNDQPISNRIFSDNFEELSVDNNFDLKIGRKETSHRYLIPAILKICPYAPTFHITWDRIVPALPTASVATASLSMTSDQEYIIVMGSPTAAGGYGHTATLSGSDSTGWLYQSKDGCVFDSATMMYSSIHDTRSFRTFDDFLTNGITANYYTNFIILKSLFSVREFQLEMHRQIIKAYWVNSSNCSEAVRDSLAEYHVWSWTQIDSTQFGLIPNNFIVNLAFKNLSVLLNQTVYTR